METKSEWKWFGGHDEEHCVYGPCDSREEVIAEAVTDGLGEFQDEAGQWKIGVYVCEAKNEPLRIAKWVDADRIIERADESVYDSDRVNIDFDDGEIFKCTPEQQADFVERIKRACDEWQDSHGLQFTVSTFSHVRNNEYVIADHRSEAA